MLTIPCDELRSDLTYILARVKNNKTPVLVTYRGKPIVQIAAIEEKAEPSKSQSYARQEQTA